MNPFLLSVHLLDLIEQLDDVMVGSKAMSELRGSPDHFSGSIALPFLIGLGTVSASVLVGSRRSAGTRFSRLP